MRFRIEQRFRAPVDAVEDALWDPAFIAAMARLPKLSRTELVSRDDNGSSLHLRIRYGFVGDLSPAVRRVVDPARLTWVEDIVVDRGTHRSRFVIEPDHYAALLQCEGRFTLSEERSGSLRIAEGDVQVSVPLVGGKVERAIVSGLQEHAEAEEELVEDWLHAAP